MGRDALAILQDKQAKMSAGREVVDLELRVTCVRAARESAGADAYEVKTLMDVEQYLKGMLPDFTTTTIKDGVIQFGGGKIIMALAGQCAAFLEDADANNYRTGLFTIGPAYEGAMQYEFSVQRVAPGKRTPAAKNSDLMRACADVVQFLRVRHSIERGTILGSEVEKHVLALEKAME